MHFIFLYMVNCNSIGCGSNLAERCFVFSLSLGSFCSSLGGFSSLGLIHRGIFTDCPPGADTVQLTLGSVVPGGSAELGFLVQLVITVVVA